MLLSLFLLMLAPGAAAQSTPAAVPPNLSAAVELAQRGRNAEALTALQAIVSANPNDREARMWIARVHDRMGQPDLAEAVYRSIALEDPKNIDAWVGVGMTLLEQDEATQAIDTLKGAEELYPGQALLNMSDVVLPQGDYLGQVDYSHRRATWSGAVRYFDFFGANVVMLSPAVTIGPTPEWTFGGLYALTATDTNVTGNVFGNTLQLCAARAVVPRVWLSGGYTHGVENFDTFSIDQIGDFDGNSGVAGIQVLLPSLTSIVGTYEYQRRPNGVTVNRVNVGFAQSF